MVKVDVDRDYYADLEVNTAATFDDIKKQFKKLGMAISELNPPSNICEADLLFS